MTANGTEQLTLTIQHSAAPPRDALDVLVRRSTLWSHTNHVRDMFLGAARLGEDTLRLAHGWWERKLVPIPYVYPLAHSRNKCMCGPKDDVSCPEGVLLPELISFYEKKSRTFAWDFEIFAFLPRERHVRRENVARIATNGRRYWKTLTPRELIAEYAHRDLASILQSVRDTLETWTGLQFYKRRSDVDDGLPSMLLHWARAMFALIEEFWCAS